MTNQIYFSTKRVLATPEMRDLQPGMRIEYPDGYVSWCPADVFARDYNPATAMSFGQALMALEKGDRVARSGWNGKGMWLRYVDPYHDKQFKVFEAPDAEGTLLPWIGMKTADNKFVPWLASQTDMLAKDWVLL